MLENLILILLAIVSILFIWLFWLRHSLIHLYRNYSQKYEILMHDFAKRRDMIPLLLEAFKKTGAPHDTWRKILEERAFFHANSTWQKELEFESEIYTFVANSTQTNLLFLEAKKDIIDLSRAIENEKKELNQAVESFNSQKKEFPYSYASAIFGLREIAL